MLQQTQVTTVLPYYARFIDRFPTVASLADSSVDEVLRYWQGLGYYRRATNMHRAARLVVAEHSGRFPSETSMLRRLPGVGRYIAGAIQSFAFGFPAAILEANSARVLSRLFAIRGPLNSSATVRTLWKLAEDLVSRERPALHNQALMELGALLCTARPHCERCPIRLSCAAKRLGLTADLPVPLRRPRPIEVNDAAAIIRSNGRVLIVKRPQRERWGGLWELPRIKVLDATDPRRTLQLHVQSQLGLEIKVGRNRLTLKHSVTHHRITLSCYESRFVKGAVDPRGYADCRWVRPEQLTDYPCSAPQRKVFTWLEGNQGGA